MLGKGWGMKYKGKGGKGVNSHKPARCQIFAATVLQLYIYLGKGGRGKGVNDR